jgi:hypothetical protein
MGYDITLEHPEAGGQDRRIHSRHPQLAETGLGMLTLIHALRRPRPDDFVTAHAGERTPSQISYSSRGWGQGDCAEVSPRHPYALTPIPYGCLPRPRLSVRARDVPILIGPPSMLEHLLSQTRRFSLF